MPHVPCTISSGTPHHSLKTQAHSYPGAFALTVPSAWSMFPRMPRWGHPSLLSLFFFNMTLFICFWPCCVFVSSRGLSQAVVSRGCSLVAMYGLHMAVVSLVAEHGL